VECPDEKQTNDIHCSVKHRLRIFLVILKILFPAVSLQKKKKKKKLTLVLLQTCNHKLTMVLLH